MYAYLAKKFAVQPAAVRQTALAWHYAHNCVALGYANGHINVLYMSAPIDEDALQDGDARVYGDVPLGVVRTVTLSAHSARITVVRFAQVQTGASNYIASGDESGLVTIWRGDEHAQHWRSYLASQHEYTMAVEDLQWTGGGDYIVIMWRDGSVVYATREGKRMWTAHVDDEPLVRLQVSSNRRTVLVAAGACVHQFDSRGNFVRKHRYAARRAHGAGGDLSDDSDDDDGIIGGSGAGGGKQGMRGRLGGGSSGKTKRAKAGDNKYESVADVAWYDSSLFGNQSSVKPSLAIAYGCGAVQLHPPKTRMFSSTPTLLATGLDVVTGLRWSRQGSVLLVFGAVKRDDAAVADGGAPSSAAADAALDHYALFYDPCLGALLHRVRFPALYARRVVDMAWGPYDLNCLAAAATGGRLVLTRVCWRADWTSVGASCVVVRRNDVASNDSIIDFLRVHSAGIKGDESVTKAPEMLAFERSHRYVKHAIGFARGVDRLNETCGVLSYNVRDADQPYALLACNTIGTVLASALLTVTPRDFQCGEHYMICCTPAFVFIWKYQHAIRASRVAADSSAAPLQLTFNVARMRVESSVSLRHVRETEEHVAPEQRTAAALLHRRVLIVCGGDGLCEVYNVETMDIIGFFDIDCVPKELALNCDATRLSVVTAEHVMYIFDVAAVGLGALCDNIDAVYNEERGHLVDAHAHAYGGKRTGSAQVEMNAAAWGHALSETCAKNVRLRAEAARLRSGSATVASTGETATSLRGSLNASALAAEALRVIAVERLRFERTSVWQVVWADDSPLLLACMEKQRMYLIRDVDPEEPIVSALPIYRYNDLEVKLFNRPLLGVRAAAASVEAAPRGNTPHVTWGAFTGYAKENAAELGFVGHGATLDAAEQSDGGSGATVAIAAAAAAAGSAYLFLGYETKSLRDTRNILREVDLQNAFAFVRDNAHPRAWQLLGRHGLREGSYNAAMDAFVECSDYSAIQFVKNVQKIQDDVLRQAEILTFFGEYDAAQAIYVANDRYDLAIELRETLGDWGVVSALLDATKDSDDATKLSILNETGEYHLERLEWQAAVAPFEATVNQRRLVECFYHLEDIDALAALLADLPDRHPLLVRLGEVFVVLGDSAHAVQAYLKAAQADLAVRTCIRFNQWEEGIDIANRHKSREIAGILHEYAAEVLSRGHTVRAIDLFDKAGDYALAARLSYEEASSALSARNLLRAKKFFILAAFAVQKDARAHRRRAKQREQQRATGGGGADGDDAVAYSYSVNDIHDAWRGAEAVHFLMLAQRMYVKQRYGQALTLAYRVCREYAPDIVPAHTAYSFLALCAHHRGDMQTYSLALRELESAEAQASVLENGGGVDGGAATALRGLTFRAFGSVSPLAQKGGDVKTRKCAKCSGGTLREYEYRCMKCGFDYVPCVATGQPLGKVTRSQACAVCRHYQSAGVIAKQLSAGHTLCPLCHHDRTQPAT